MVVAEVLVVERRVLVVEEAEAEAEAVEADAVMLMEALALALALALASPQDHRAGLRPPALQSAPLH